VIEEYLLEIIDKPDPDRAVAEEERGW